MSDLRKLLTDYIDKSGLKQASIARALGIHPGRLNQWLFGKYQGDNKKIDDAVQSFLQRQEEKDSTEKFQTVFCQTSNAKMIFEVARFCHLMSKIGVVYGDAGLGKTIACEEYEKQNPGVLLLKANLAFTTKITIANLHQAIGMTGIGSIYNMHRDIIDKLKGSGRMIIVDQAEYLPYRALELLRTVYDEAGIGILLVGMPRLIHNLKGLHGQFKQLFSRVTMAGKLNKLTEDDVKQILQSKIKNASNDVLKAFIETSGGNGRVLSNMIECSTHIAKINKKTLDKDIINETARLLII